MISGWVIAAGIVIASLAVLHFWEDIASWLNNVAANAVERKFGINARNLMQKAVCRVTRVMDKINNVARVFLKADRTGFLRQIDFLMNLIYYNQTKKEGTYYVQIKKKFQCRI